VILEDFDTNASFKSDRWNKLLDLLRPIGVVSAWLRE
jgi:hypothetical protein